MDYFRESNLCVEDAASNMPPFGAVEGNVKLRSYQNEALTGG
jgi:hypothetical protein